MFSGIAGKSRFLAEFTLSPFASLRAVRRGMANGLGMTAPNPFFTSLLGTFFQDNFLSGLLTFVTH